MSSTRMATVPSHRPPGPSGPLHSPSSLLVNQCKLPFNLSAIDVTLLKDIYKHRLSEHRLLVIAGVGGGWEEGIVRKFGVDTYTLVYVKWTTNKDLPV